MAKPKRILEQSQREFEETVRNDERLRIAGMLDEGATTIGNFAKDGESAVRVVALMLRGCVTP